MFFFNKSARQTVADEKSNDIQASEEILADGVKDADACFVIVDSDGADYDDIEADAPAAEESARAIESGYLTSDAQQALQDATWTSDLTLITRDNVALECHRSQLANISDVFRTLLEGLPASETLQLDLPFESLAALIEFTYGKVDNVNNIASAAAIVHEATAAAAAAQTFGCAALWGRAEELMTWYTHHHLAASSLPALVEAAELFGFATAFSNCITWAAKNIEQLRGSSDDIVLENLSPKALAAVLRVREEVSRAALMAYSNSAFDLATRHEMAWQNYFVERSQGGQLAATTILVRAATSAAVREWATPLAAGYPPQVKAAIEKAYPRSKELCRS